MSNKDIDNNISPKKRNKKLKKKKTNKKRF